MVNHWLVGCLCCFELGCAGDLIHLTIVNDLVADGFDDRFAVFHGSILTGFAGTLHQIVQLVALLLSGREKFEESLGKFLVDEAEHVFEVFLVDRELCDVEVQVPEGGVAEG